MARDLYGEARALSVALWDAGMSGWSERIDDVMRGGSTPSEILMGLRWTVSEALRSETSLVGELRQQSEELVRGIDASLR